MLKMRKPRLSEKTLERLFDEGRAATGKYEYEITERWNDKLNAYEEVLTRWGNDNNYVEWEVPAQGIWTFKA